MMFQMIRQIQRKKNISAGIPKILFAYCLAEQIKSPLREEEYQKPVAMYHGTSKGKYNQIVIFGIYLGLYLWPAPFLRSRNRSGRVDSWVATFR